MYNIWKILKRFAGTFRQAQTIKLGGVSSCACVVSGPDCTYDLFCDIGTINLQVGSNARNLSIHHRFYVALALNDLVNEVSLSRVAKKYDASKGMLQGLQQTVSTFAGMVSNK